jgi:hypothetical protein
MMEPVITEEEEDEVLRRWAAGDDAFEGGERRMEGRVRVSQEERRGSVQEGRCESRSADGKKDGCQGENQDHRCRVLGLVELDGSDLNTLAVGLGIVSGRKEILGTEGKAGGVWVQIAIE